MRIIIFTIFSVLTGIAIASEPVDFNPNLLSKVIKKQYDLSEFRMHEITQSAKANYQADNPGKYYKLQSSGDNSDSFYVYIGRVFSCRAGGCDNPLHNTLLTESEYFDYFIIFNAAKTVEAVRIYNYQASHGQEVTATGWLKQFAGYDGHKSLIVGRGIDAISGATISADAITMDLQLRSREIRALIE